MKSEYEDGEGPREETLGGVTEVTSSVQTEGDWG